MISGRTRDCRRSTIRHRGPSISTFRNGVPALDTNIVSQLVARPHGEIAERVGELGEDRAVTSMIVAAELRFRRLSFRIEAVLKGLQVLPFEAPADAVYARLGADLERRGRPIGGNDLLIAAQALAVGHVLVSDNEREFARVAGLQVENWLRTRRARR
ncbi:MAG: type II toxin-antitoxin system VapC family toxin [Alphaproteobacteria bacterium]|nr:type II toxin-antitoxin system VapC family toxin [Alphaproteobacteria bacterium]